MGTSTTTTTTISTTSSTSTTLTTSTATTTTTTTTTATTTTVTTTSVTSTEATTTKECKDKWWCRWKPRWKCNYYEIVRRLCPIKCGTCNEDSMTTTTTTTTTTTPSTCTDRYNFWCAINFWRCRWSNRVRRNCRNTCRLC